MPGRLHRNLDVRIQRGADQVTATGHLFLTDPRAREVLLDVVAEEGAIAGRDAAARQLVGLRQDAERLGLGGAQGLGAAITEHLAEEGCDVVVWDINLEQARATAADVAARTGRLVEGRAVDVTDADAVRDADELDATAAATPAEVRCRTPVASTVTTTLPPWVGGFE